MAVKVDEKIKVWLGDRVLLVTVTVGVNVVVCEELNVGVYVSVVVDVVVNIQEGVYEADRLGVGEPKVAATVGVEVRVRLAVGVKANVVVLEGVSVPALVKVADGMGVRLAVSVNVEVGVEVEVNVEVKVGVKVRVAVGVKVAVGVGVTVHKKPQNEGRLLGIVQAVRSRAPIRHDRILLKRIDFSNITCPHHTGRIL